jgi:hypothetical protein
VQRPGFSGLSVVGVHVISVALPRATRGVQHCFSFQLTRNLNIIHRYVYSYRIMYDSQLHQKWMTEVLERRNPCGAAESEIAVPNASRPSRRFFDADLIIFGLNQALHPPLLTPARSGRSQ